MLPEVQQPSQCPDRVRLHSDVVLQLIEKTVLSWGIIRKSAHILTEITIRTSQHRETSWISVCLTRGKSTLACVLMLCPVPSPKNLQEEVSYSREDDCPHLERSNTEADARAKMLIYLLENGLYRV